MRNAWLLCKVQIEGLLRVRVHKTGAALTLLLYALAGVGIMAYSGVMTWLLVSEGFGEVAVIMMLVAASLVALVTTCMKGSGMLLSCRDYDFIAALPMTTAQHVGGRLLSIYLGELCFFVALLVPAGAVYAWGRGVMPFMAVLGILPFAPLIPLALGTLVGALVQVITARTRHAWLWALLLSVAGTLGILALSTGLSLNMAGMEDAQLFQLTQWAQDVIAGIYPPAQALVGALNGNYSQLLVFAVASVIVSALVVGALAHFYGAIQARLSARYRAKDFHLGAMVVKRPLTALYQKEIGRIFSLWLYAMNVLVGPILYVAAGVAAYVLGAGRIMGMLKMVGVQDYVLMVVPLMGAMLVSMTTASACAESMEGKARWIAQSAPISRGAYRRAKLLASATLQWAGALLGGALIALALKADWAWAALFMLMPAAWAALTSACGLALNLKWPRYDWVSEQQVVKQGLPVLLGILFDMVITVGAGALVILFYERAQAMLWALTALFALAGGIWWAWLCRKEGG